MNSFKGKIAVVTGGGSGMGRELVKLLAEQGCHVAFCDIIDANMEKTLGDCTQAIANGTRVTAHHCDVASEADLEHLRGEVAKQHDTEHINLLFNNAGLSGGQSFIRDDREQWDRIFGICWGGVYLGCRVFMPMLMASDEAHIVNTSSVNGFWACLGGAFEHTAYSSAKFAVKGFSEALVVDLRINAPHVGVSVVMPGHIGTDIALNSQHNLVGNLDSMDSAALNRVRRRWATINQGAMELSDEMVRQMVQAGGESFRDDAPTSALQAAEIILDGVRRKHWRILVGDDAVQLDRAVRENPEAAYDQDFFSFLQASL